MRNTLSWMTKALVLLLVVSGAAWLTTLNDSGVGTGWVQNVVRNWNQFGCFSLQGKLIDNPGGFAVETDPHVYPGHRPQSVYLVYICYHFLGGEKVGFLAYYAIVSAIVLISSWHLFGRSDRAFWLAATIVLTPGYLRWQNTLDPNLAAALYGFPFCALMLSLLRQKSLKWKDWGAVLLLIVVYSSINWTTAFIHAILFWTLVVTPAIPRRNIIGYTVIAAIAGGCVLLTSVASKMGGASGSGGGMSEILGGYGWGNVGYGVGLTTKTAFLRIATANLMGLLPALVFIGWFLFQHPRYRPGSMLFIVPALVPVLEVAAMRNYFGVHPWMSVHFILLGIVMAGTVFRDNISVPVKPEPHRAFRVGCLVATFVYTFAILTIGRVNVGNQVNLVALVQQQSPRGAALIVCQATDPELIEPRWTGIFDRRIIPVPDLSEASLSQLPEKRMILTSSRLPQGKIVAETTSLSQENPLVQKLLDLFSRHIANRRPGEKLTVGEHYFLYQVPG